MQGDEKKIIILSFVRSNSWKDSDASDPARGAGQRVGFVQHYRRLNVALTRAQHNLLMFGNLATLEGTPGLLGDLMAQLKATNRIRENPYLTSLPANPTVGLAVPAPLKEEEDATPPPPSPPVVVSAASAKHDPTAAKTLKVRQQSCPPPSPILWLYVV